MSTFTPALNLLIRRQHSVVSAEQLEIHGITRQRRRTVFGNGVFDVVHRGVYILASAEHTIEARSVAACLANPRLVICGPTAGRIYRLRKMFGDDVHAMALNACPQLDGVVTHRTNRLSAEDIEVRPDGIRILRAPRLTHNLADHLDDQGFESVIEQLLDRRAVTIPQLFAADRALRQRGRDGAARFARVLSKRPAFAKPKNSDLEVRVLGALARRGILLVPQYEITLPDGSVIHPDGGDPSRRFGVEVDHVTWHGGRARSQYDKWRDRQTSRMGGVIPRVTDEDLRSRFHAMINELVELHEGRAAA